MAGCNLPRAPQMPSREVQAALQEQFGIHVSIGHLNRVRAQLGIGNHVGRSKKKQQTPCSSQEAQETGLLPALETALASCTPQDDSRLARLSPLSRRRLVLTLLFLNAVGLRRTWDLRSYAGDGLALLSGRKRAYGYSYTERMLSHLAQARGDEALTNALAAWTVHLWHAPTGPSSTVRQRRLHD
jgi:hypothetical protein